MADVSVGPPMGCRQSGRRLISGLMGLVLTLSVEAARGQELEAPPRPTGASPTSLARFVPRQDLGLYLEFQGLRAAPRRLAQGRLRTKY